MKIQRLFRLTVPLLAAALLFSRAAAQAPEATESPAAPDPYQVEVLLPRVVTDYPHDTDSYTQGLVLHEGVLLESAGLYGESDLRRVDLQTGEVLQQTDLPPEYFAEGLALVDDRLIQITWKETTAFIWDAETFEQEGTFSYEGEGWGLCYDGETLWMSDGSDGLYARDPQTFALIERISVTLQGQIVSRLNELECVGDSIYANVYLTDVILRIDKASGIVTGLVYAADLLTEAERATLQSGEVLNGIAYNPESETFLITGKHWPKLFEVNFEAVGLLPPTRTPTPAPGG